jgi:hypothetical protein
LTRTFLVLARARGATASEDRFRLGVGLAVLGLICIMLFEGGGAFLPKRTTGAIGKKQKGDPSSFIGSGPSSCCRNKERNQKGFNKSQKRNVSQEAIPLRQECRIQGGSAAASDPELFGKREFSTSTTTPQNRQPKK